LRDFARSRSDDSVGAQAKADLKRDGRPRGLHAVDPVRDDGRKGAPQFRTLAQLHQELLPAENVFAPGSPLELPDPQRRHFT